MYYSSGNERFKIPLFILFCTATGLNQCLLTDPYSYPADALICYGPAIFGFIVLAIPKNIFDDKKETIVKYSAKLMDLIIGLGSMCLEFC